MKAAVRLGLAALAVSLAAGAATAATVTPRIVEAGGVSFPERSYVLTLPVPRSLKPGDVKVTENGLRAPILGLVRQGTGNSSSAVVIALDESLTMAGKPIADAVAAARQFAVQANPNVTIALVAFNGKVNVVQGFTTSATKISQALSGTPKVGYGTKNYDALQKGLDMLAGENAASGSIIMLTDGQNVGSVAKPAAVLRELAKAHIRVFTVGLFSPAFDPVQLKKIASATGGLFVRANGPSQLGPIVRALGRQLSSEYLLTYTSRSNPATKVVVHVAVNGVGQP